MAAAAQLRRLMLPLSLGYLGLIFQSNAKAFTAFENNNGTITEVSTEIV